MAKKPKLKKSFVKMQLVDNADSLHKSLTVIGAVALTLLNAIALGWQEIQGVEFISADKWLAINAILAALIAAARYIKQPTVSGDA